MNKEWNIIVCGLGGQGVVMAARILGEAAFADGYRVLTSDVPPVTQRFECLYSFVRIGDVYSETFPEGEADFLLGFDAVQALKVGLAFASENGTVLLNERIIDTIPYPLPKSPSLEEIKGYFDQIGVKDVRHFNASQIAIQETGSIGSTNMVMLGALCSIGNFPVQRESIISAIKKLSPSYAIKENCKAFEAGTKSII
jgi:indolepyruvate ferredoxin oxidoreductase beta subunit